MSYVLGFETEEIMERFGGDGLKRVRVEGRSTPSWLVVEGVWHEAELVPYDDLR